MIGYDGIVLAHSQATAADFDLTEAQLFLALASEVAVDGALVANPYKNWNEIDPSLPDEPIEVLGPPPTSGTRDAFVELVHGRGLRRRSRRSRRSKDDEPRRPSASAMRQDGAFIEAGENDNLIVQKLEANASALGIFGYQLPRQNTDKLQRRADRRRGARRSRPSPTAATPSRAPLFFYVKNAHRGVIPGIDEFVDRVRHRGSGSARTATWPSGPDPAARRRAPAGARPRRAAGAATEPLQRRADGRGAPVPAAALCRSVEP